MTECGGYEQTGRYLGVNACFYYGGSISSWVYVAYKLQYTTD